jgi:polysaccharide biosynthesis/export protein
MARAIARCIICILFLAGVSGLVSGCGSAGGSIAIEQYKEPPAPAAAEYTIAVGDTLSIQVWDQPQMSGKMRVRTDGRVSVPFVSDVTAAGKTPTKLAADLEAGLKSVVLNPKVNVVIEESKPLTISVLGEVAKPGAQTLEGEVGLAQALAAAGGFTNFAHKDRIFVVRGTPQPIRLHFTYKALTQRVGPATAFRLRAGDIIVVE